MGAICRRIAAVPAEISPNEAEAALALQRKFPGSDLYIKYFPDGTAHPVVALPPWVNIHKPPK